MPVISMFYGIIIQMFFGDQQRHNLPHIHVEYGEHSAIVSIPDGEVLEGSLPKNKMRLVQAWVEIHQEDLMANWTLAVKRQPVFKIEALK